MTRTQSSWSPELRAKLAKLLRLIASPREGEALAAARAIERTLASEGADIHDLAAALTGMAADEASQPSQSADLKKSPIPPGDQSESRNILDEYLRFFWIGYCRWCIRRRAELTGAELLFVEKMLEALGADQPYNDSDMQQLMRICERLERSGGAGSPS